MFGWLVGWLFVCLYRIGMRGISYERVGFEMNGIDFIVMHLSIIF